MKKIYEQLRLSVVDFSVTDIVCSSAEPAEITDYDVGGKWHENWFKTND